MDRHNSRSNSGAFTVPVISATKLYCVPYFTGRIFYQWRFFSKLYCLYKINIIETVLSNCNYTKKALSHSTKRFFGRGDVIRKRLCHGIAIAACNANRVTKQPYRLRVILLKKRSVFRLNAFFGRGDVIRKRLRRGIAIAACNANRVTKQPTGCV